MKVINESKHDYIRVNVYKNSEREYSYPDDYYRNLIHVIIFNDNDFNFFELRLISINHISTVDPPPDTYYCLFRLSNDKERRNFEAKKFIEILKYFYSNNSDFKQVIDKYVIGNFNFEIIIKLFQELINSTDLNSLKEDYRYLNLDLSCRY